MYKESKYLIELLARFTIELIILPQTKLQSLSSLPLLTIEPGEWQDAFRIASEFKWRLVGVFAGDLIEKIEINGCIESNGQYLIIRTNLDINKLNLDSITIYYPSANRLERHMKDMFGIKLIGHPEPNRWTKHKAWGANQFPLRKNFPSEISAKTSGVNGQQSLYTCDEQRLLPHKEDEQQDEPRATTPSDSDYPFIKSQGPGTFEIPVGPVHAGIIEPGHFRFQVAGEDIINLEERLGYVHKGIEKIAEGRTIDKLIRLAGRVSGDSTVVHAWAACQAIESAIDLSVPERALLIRAIMSERERVANHLGDFAAICNDVGFGFAYHQLMRLKELWLRCNLDIFGHRLMMDCISFGGVNIDLNDAQQNEMKQQIAKLRQELEELYPIFEANSSLHDRLKTTGILSSKIASKLGVLGYIGKASSHGYDMRVNAPYPPYDKFSVKVPVIAYGDVLARVRVRAQEIMISLDLIEKMLSLPEGPIKLNVDSPNDSEGVGLIEGWRGEIFAYVKIKNAKVERYFPRDPSWFSWLALEKLVNGNIVPDFPVCNKSVNASYSGVDL